MAQQWIEGPAESLDETDRRIFFTVRKVLWNYEPLRASGAQIAVDVVHGTSHVSGRVRSRAHKEIVTHLLRATRGVVDVENAIVSDPEVVRAVADALASDPETAAWVVQVESRLGATTLSGAVPSDRVASRAVELASQVPLVTDVESHLVVDPALPTSSRLEPVGASGRAG